MPSNNSRIVHTMALAGMAVVVDGGMVEGKEFNESAKKIKAICRGSTPNNRQPAGDYHWPGFQVSVRKAANSFSTQFIICLNNSWSGSLSVKSFLD